jgi:hypothetical protein
LERDVLKIEVLIVVLFALAEQFVVEGLVAQKAQFEDKSNAFLELNSCRLGQLVSLQGFNELFHFQVVEGEEDGNLVDGLDQVEVVQMLVKTYLAVAEHVAESPHHVLQPSQVLFAHLVLKQTHQHIKQHLYLVVLQPRLRVTHLAKLLHDVPDLLLLVLD